MGACDSLAWGASVTPSKDGRLRVAIPAVENRDAGHSSTLQDEFIQFTGMVFRERAAECRTFDLVSRGRCDAIMRRLTDSMRRRPADLLAEFRRYQPVDIVVYYNLTPQKCIEIAVCGDQGTRTLTIDAAPFMASSERPPNFALPALVQKTLEAIAARLPVNESDRRCLSESRIEGVDFLTVYYARREPDTEPKPGTLVPPTDSGLPQLKGLMSAWRMDKPNRELAREVVRFARILCLSASEPTPDGFRTVPRWIAANGNAKWMVMFKSCFQELLGTPDEPRVYPVAQMAPGLIGRETLGLARPLFVEFALESTLEGGGLDGGPGNEFGGKPLPAGDTGSGPPQRAKALGAIRLLGMLASPEAVATLQAALSDKGAEIRTAAAFSAGFLPKSTGEPMLLPMLKDREPAVAFAAACALKRLGTVTPDLLRLARQFAALPGDAADEATLVLAELAEKGDVPLLLRLADERPRQRAALVKALLRLKAADVRRLAAWLDDLDEAVILAALEAPLEDEAVAAVGDRLTVLSDDPYRPVADCARRHLRRQRPADPWEVLAAELRAEHPYVRECILERLAGDRDARAGRLIEDACDNSDAQVRVSALRILAGRDPSAARPRLLRALADDDPWVSFHAAALSPQIAVQDMATALRSALARNPPAAASLYLRQALARAEDTPLPAPRPCARPLVSKDRHYVWGTTPGLYTATSPFDAYYCMDTKRLDSLRAAHAAGKVLVARAHPLRVPARLVLDPSVRNEVLAQLDDELSGAVMEVLDGIVYGEETMDYPSDPLWPEAWMLFCRDAHVDPARIDGKIGNLNVFEKRAWNDWTRRLHIRGFNMLYDLTKLRYGVLRPGLQVGTFQWAGVEQKSDFGGLYDYKGDNRLCAYDLVRCQKTLYPDRPLLWLSLGIGGYEMNPVHNTDGVPSEPIFETWGRAWSDSVTAWLAGAENGWFSVWLFVSPVKGRTDSGMSSLRGKIVWVDDIGPDSPLLKAGIDWSFAYTSTYKEKIGLPELPGELAKKDDDPGEFLEDHEQERVRAQQELDREIGAGREAMKTGFLFYQQHVYDCARVFASLPPVQSRAPALVCREDVTVWTRPETGYPLVPAAALLNRYDCLPCINLAPRLDLSAYRLFIVHDPSLLQDAAIRTVTEWLKRCPGLLVAHRNIPSGNDAEASTVEAHDGRLDEDWPWERDVRIVTNGVTLEKTTHPLQVTFADRVEPLTHGYVGATFELSGTNATSLARVGGQTVLALWRHPAFKGAVLFDGLEHVSNEYLDALRNVINGLNRDEGVGMKVEGPALLETLNSPAIAAAAATRYYHEVKESVILPGLDVLSGSANPAVGRLIGSVSALTLNNYTGRYVAASESLTALSERPFTEARVDGEALVLKSEGVVRVGSLSGAVVLEPVDGRPLPVTRISSEGPATNGLARWLFASGEEGAYVLESRSLTYFRARQPVKVTPAYAPAGSTESRKERVEQRAGVAGEGPRDAIEELNLDLGDGVRMSLVKIKTLGLWVGTYEVTNREFRRFSPGHRSRNASFDGDRQPVVDVCHAEAAAFADWVNRDHGGALPAGWAARLPTGKEWTAYAQCGDGRVYPWGNAWPPAYGNYADQTNRVPGLVGDYRDGHEVSCPVEESGCNRWGLYGVGGNVSEWTDELTERDGEWRIRRGGWWGWELWGPQGYEEDLRCAHRSYAFPSLRHTGTGFRLVLAPRNGKEMAP